MSGFSVERPGRGVMLPSVGKAAKRRRGGNEPVVSVEEYRVMQASRMSERELQEFVRRTAEMFGWLYYHTHDSRRSGAGFPDCVLVKPAPEGEGRREKGAGGRVIYAELKRQREDLRPEQRVWMSALEAAGQECYVWRPSDMEEIERVLSGAVEGPGIRG